LLALLFFGVCGAIAIPKYLRRKVSMELSGEGIKIFYAEGYAFLHWADVDQIGIIRIASSKMVGIRLRSYDRFLDDFSPDAAALFAKNLPYLKLLAKAVSSLDFSIGGVGLWLKAEGKSLESLGEVGNLAQSLLWLRENYGYDLAFAWSDLDRSAEKFVALLQEYRARV
jgi:hypothetical protein